MSKRLRIKLQFDDHNLVDKSAVKMVKHFAAYVQLYLAPPGYHMVANHPGFPALK